MIDSHFVAMASPLTTSVSVSQFLNNCHHFPSKRLFLPSQSILSSTPSITFSNGVKTSSLCKLRKPFHLNSRFFQMDSKETCNSRKISVNSISSDGNAASTTLSQSVFGIFHLLVSLGIILAMDTLLKKAFVAAAIKFPSALFGMFCIFSVLLILDSTIPAAAKGLVNFFEPALLFIQR